MSIFRHETTMARALDGGARISRHRHAEHQVVYPSSGVAEVRTAAGTWIAPADRAIWIPAGCWHEHHFYGPTQFHCVGFPFDLAPDWTVPSVLTALPLVRELIITCSTAEDLPDTELVALRQALLDQLRRSPEQPLRLPAARDERLRKACALVESDLTEVWTLGALGRQVGASERTLTRLFRTELAMTYPQWRTQLRLHHAVQLLAEQVPVTVVAHRCGWSSASAFIEVYRRTLGHTPGTYRMR
ncbi:AraC family transcriptional regulator [Nocardia altamirensis]|uniref:AraC family transcriptional regulator n=1 Tax=Nocardia altamirensis TaxID=472158 RepID=UPI0008407295|nr:helix-turn-helix transcriptional regulator [Nocardia altamirensis]